MKVCLVHDDFVQEGGAERLFEAIAAIWPKAPVFTSMVDWRKLPAGIDRLRVRPSWMQRIPFKKVLYKVLLLFYPLAFESFNFDKYDVVISSTTRFAKSIITKPKTLHICYINSVPRFLWKKEAQDVYLPKFLTVVLSPFFSWLRRWDKVSASRVDFYIANSKNVADEVKKVYRRNADVVYPFADVDFFAPAKIHNWKLKSQNYFLVVSRLVRWKRIDIVIKAACELGVNLKIVGSGPDERRLKRLANSCWKLEKKNIEFLGNVDRERLRELYQNAKALIVTQSEDFGIATVEAQACGIPVIAYKLGGQRDIIKDAKTGLFFGEQTAESLKDAIVRFDGLKWNVPTNCENARRFARGEFEKNLKGKIEEYAGRE